MISLLQNYTRVVTILEHNANLYQRKTPELLAVAKNQDVDKLEMLLAKGHRLFGENRVQEAAGKWPLLKERYPDCRLHLIGPLQTNKVKQAVRLFDVIETLDRPSLAETIASAFALLGIRRSLLIQVNTGREPQKSGVLPEDFNVLLNTARTLDLPVIGLMCVPPVNEDPTPHFAMLEELAKTYNLPHLSMGMSEDFPKAIAYGTSWVRVGTALFGQR